MDNAQKIAIHTAYVTLASKNLELLVAFYQGLLEHPPHPYMPGHYAEFSLPALKLALFKPNTAHLEEFSGPAGSMSLCLEVKNLECAIAQLTNLGYPPPGQIIDASHGQEIYAYDPAGNRLILHQSQPNPSD